jgi:serine/threonine protein kinase/Tol biopolymer transport system component
MIGATLAQYRVTAALGAGGMGQVWRAEDSKLGREVALKALPEEFARDPERMARFEREAKVLASLNHPSIATLYGLETAESGTGTGLDSSPEPGAPGPITFLAMELVEGEDLSEHIKRGPIPIEKASAIALQIAEALEAAHEQGIVHRDLKPANIKIRTDGTVKVLDFGLAKAWESHHGDSSVSLSPTITQHATAAGLILGTAAYMSPEQAAGTPADRRADIWSFGVVLWEMLTGNKLFDGQTVSHVLAAVLKDEADLSELPAATPLRMRELLRRCLEKDPKERLQAIGEARISLQEQQKNPDGRTFSADRAETGSDRTPSRWRAVAPWAMALLAGVVAAAAIVLAVNRQPPRVFQTTLPPPTDTTFHLTGVTPGPAVLSPDGTRVAFSARNADGVAQLFLRALDQPEAHVVSGTDGAQYPFWSPDSGWVAFFTMADGTLKKVDASGGPPITLCDASNGKGGSWGSDDVIVFAPDSDTPIHSVSASGGESRPVTEIEKGRHNSHRHPRFLPDGRRFLYFARGAKAGESVIEVGSLDGDGGRELVRGDTQAEYAAGYLFFIRDQTLMAQPFDPQALEFDGEAKPLAENALTVPAAALGVFTVSPAGLLAYHSGGLNASVTPKWFDRSGREVGVLGAPGEYSSGVLSPDGGRVAFTMLMGATGTYDIWIYDLTRDLRTRFTFDDGLDWWPAWSPDGMSLAFTSNRGGSGNIYRMDIDGVGEAELVVESDREIILADWSPDGKWLVYAENDQQLNQEIYAAPVDGQGERRRLRSRPGVDSPSALSPDGRWLAYASDESGTVEIYLTPFPDAGRRWQVSDGTGYYAFWNANGSELIYQQLDGRLISVAVELGEDSVRLGEANELFDMAPPEPTGPSFALAPDGERILVIPKDNGSSTTLLNLVVGWPQMLER